jgi:hypothetical protein
VCGLDEDERRVVGGSGLQPRQHVLEGTGGGHLGHHGPAALFGRRHGNPRPALQPSSTLDRGGSHFRVRRDEWLHPRHAEHHRIADDVVHLVALEQGHRQREGRGRLGDRRHRSSGEQLDPVRRGRFHTGLELEPSPVEHTHGVAHPRAQHADEMPALVDRQHDALTDTRDRRRMDTGTHVAIMHRGRSPSREHGTIRLV